MPKSSLAVIIMSLWFILSFYFGVGGLTKIEFTRVVEEAAAQTDTKEVIYQGVSFDNKAALTKVLEERQINFLFPWINKIPTYVGYLLACCSFGVLGTIIQLVLAIVIKKMKPEDLNYFSVPILGLLTGLVVLAITEIFPSFFFEKDVKIKSSTIMFISLFAGVYCISFYKMLESKVKKNMLKD